MLRFLQREPWSSHLAPHEAFRAHLDEVIRQANPAHPMPARAAED